MTTLRFTNRFEHLEVPFKNSGVCECVFEHAEMCVVFNYVHVFALFRGSLYLFSLCVSRVVFVRVVVFAYSERYKWISACPPMIDRLPFPQTLTISRFL